VTARIKRSRIIWEQLEGLFNVWQPLRRLGRLKVGPGARIVSGGEFWIELDRLAEIGDGGAEIALLSVVEGAVVLDRGLPFDLRLRERIRVEELGAQQCSQGKMPHCRGPCFSWPWHMTGIRTHGKPPRKLRLAPVHLEKYSLEAGRSVIEVASDVIALLVCPLKW
jgi:hypothetical protein